MRILCGLDPQYTGEVTVYEENADREVGEGGDSAAEKAVGGTPDVNRDINVEAIGNTREEIFRSSSLRHRSPLVVESRTQSPCESSAGSQRNSYWRDIILYFLTSSIQWAATARKFINRRTDILFPPKRKRARRCVGWCSQEDALFEYLSVREHIELFDSLLGNSEGVSDSVNYTGASFDDISVAEVDPGLSLQSKLKWLLSFLVTVEKRDIRKLAQSLHLSRLGMAEHSEKMAMELSGKSEDSCASCV